MDEKYLKLFTSSLAKNVGITHRDNIIIYLPTVNRYLSIKQVGESSF